MKNFSLVTCGGCGCALVHESDADFLECPNCSFLGDTCDFPDLFIDKYEFDELQESESMNANEIFSISGIAKVIEEKDYNLKNLKK